MEAYSNSYSSSKSSSLTQNHEAKTLKSADSAQSHAFLHSVRKSQTKPSKKAPVAPPPPTPVKVYKVHPMNFRDLVQQLTAAPEFAPPTSSIVDSPTNPILSGRDVAAAPSTVSTNWYLGGHLRH